MSKFAWAPIRKVAVGFAASAVVYGAHRLLHVDLAPEAVEEALIPVVGFLASWAVKDPRVKAAADELEDSVLAAQIEDAILDALAKLEK